MQFDIVCQGGSTTAEARAYAEFRLFITLARHARLIRIVQVVLNRAAATGCPIVCAALSTWSSSRPAPRACVHAGRTRAVR